MQYLHCLLIYLLYLMCSFDIQYLSSAIFSDILYFLYLMSSFFKKYLYLYRLIHLLYFLTHLIYLMSFFSIQYLLYPLIYILSLESSSFIEYLPYRLIFVIYLLILLLSDEFNIHTVSSLSFFIIPSYITFYILSYLFM